MFKLFGVPEQLQVSTGELKMRRTYLVSFLCWVVIIVFVELRNISLDKSLQTLEENVPTDEVLLCPPALDWDNDWDYSPTQD